MWRRALAGYGHRSTPQWAAAKLLLRRTPRQEFRAAFDEGEPVVSPGCGPSPGWRRPGGDAAGEQAVVKSVHGTLALSG